MPDSKKQSKEPKFQFTEQEEEKIKKFAMDKRGAYIKKSWTMPELPWKKNKEADEDGRGQTEGEGEKKDDLS